MKMRPSATRAPRVCATAALLLLLGSAAAPGCRASDGLDLTVDGTEFDHWAWADGKRVWVRAFGPEAPAGPAKSTFILGGAFRLAWPDTLRPGVAYTVRYSVDTNGNGVCDAGDSGFTVEISPARANVTQAISPQDPSRAADLCRYFD